MKYLRNKWLLLVFFLLVSYLGINAANLFSNAYFFIDRGDSELYIKKNITVHENEYVKINELEYKRKKGSLIYKAYASIFPQKLYLFEFKKNDHHFKILENNEDKSVIDLEEKAQFIINSAFYDKKGENVGELIIEGEEVEEKKKSSSGFFRVIDGKAWAGPRSFIEAKKGKVDYSCQAHPSIMKNGIIWEYILDETRNSSDKRLTYRNLIGMHENGNICFLVSNRGAVLRVKEMALLAKENHIQTATLFDAGSALQYQYNDDDYYLTFSTFNNRWNAFGLLNWTSQKILKANLYSFSPSYIFYSIED